jgi:ADP-ribose pyrophosphatase YjhB (NUDIX family)
LAVSASMLLGGVDPNWLAWARRLQAIAQNGLTFTRDPFDRERYEQVRAIAAEIVATHSSTHVDRVLEALWEGSGYATPKIDIRGAVFRAEEILLVRERSDGLWTLPGGWVDLGEAPSEAVVREVFEESGYHTRATKLLAVYDKLRHSHPPGLHHAYKLFFGCELLGGSPTVGTEIEQVGFFPENAIPPLSPSRVTASQIQRMFEHRRHPEWPTEFD